MLTDIPVTFYYTFIHIAPFDFLIFYLFRQWLRWSPGYTAAGYACLLILEATVQILHGGIYDQTISLLFQLIYALYDLIAIRDYIPRILTIGFLTVPPELLFYNIANYTGTHTAAPYLTASLLLTLFYIAMLLPFIRYARHSIEAMLKIREKVVWNYLFSYESIAIVLTIAIDPLNTATTLPVLLSRALLFINNIVCLRTAHYLCQQINRREYSSQTLNSLQKLYEVEKRRHSVIMEEWYASRRLRHDMRHHLLAIHAFLQRHDYTGLKKYLGKFTSHPYDPPTNP